MERSYADRADSATNFDPEMQFDKDIDKRDLIISMHQELVAALKATRRYVVAYYNAALLSNDSAKAFDHQAELQMIDAVLQKAKQGDKP